MKVYIINLPKDKERREFQILQLEKLGLEYEIVNAQTIDDIKPWIQEKHKNDWQRPLKKVEIACYYSHRLLWERIIEINEPALILEDDALMSKCVPDVLKYIAKLDNIDYVTLEVRGRKKMLANSGTIISSDCKFKLYRLYLDRTGAAGYVLFPSGAEKLLKMEKKSGIGLADAHITACYELIGYQVEPAPLVQLDKCEYYNLLSPLVVKSNISSRVIPRINFIQKIFFKFKRIKAQIEQGIQQMKNIFCGTRREVEIKHEDFEIEK